MLRLLGMPHAPWGASIRSDFRQALVNLRHAPAAPIRAWSHCWSAATWERCDRRYHHRLVCDYLLMSSRKRVFRAISTGERLVDSSQATKSRIRTLCSTSGCLTTTVIVVWPRPIWPVQLASRKAVKPRATASYKPSALTSTVCSKPSTSQQVTLQVRRGTSQP
jgi:hypothetical protein